MDYLLQNFYISFVCIGKKYRFSKQFLLLKCATKNVKNGTTKYTTIKAMSINGLMWFLSDN